MFNKVCSVHCSGFELVFHDKRETRRVEILPCTTRHLTNLLGPSKTAHRCNNYFSFKDFYGFQSFDVHSSIATVCSFCYFSQIDSEYVFLAVRLTDWFNLDKKSNNNNKETNQQQRKTLTKRLLQFCSQLFVFIFFNWKKSICITSWYTMHDRKRKRMGNHHFKCDSTSNENHTFCSLLIKKNRFSLSPHFFSLSLSLSIALHNFDRVWYMSERFKLLFLPWMNIGLC